MLSINTSIGQKLKSYKGEFNDGTANYSYFEDAEFNRHFQGPFSYIGKRYNVNGQFKDGKQSGEWNISANNKIYENPGAKFQINANIYGSYNQGNLDGLWTYSNSMRMCYYDRWDTGTDTEKSTANFKDGHFVGKISYSKNWPQILTVLGQFDDTGRLEGTWTFDGKTERDIIKYMNGIAYWRLRQNITTGEKLVYYDNTAFVKEFWSKFDTVSNTAVINGIKYYPVKIQILDRHSEEGVIYSMNFAYASIKELINPAINLWTSETIELYGNQGLTNPIYYFKTKLTKVPYCYEIIIQEM